MSLLHQDDDQEFEAPEREVTLSTGALVGIFAGLVMLCALFFALGYAVRGRQTPAPIIAAAAPTTENSPASQANFNTFKPAAGSPVAGAPRLNTTEASTIKPAETRASEKPPVAPEAGADVPKEAAPLVKPTTPVRPAPAAAATTAPGLIPEGSFIVQVAAVSHPEDAQYVVAALKAKGYPAAARSEPQDKLLHIQVGPYANRKDAEAMKQRLAADGYNNPIIK